ncbi:hypothetical protein JZ751_011193 [Albula glossodonta]|uniref:Zasp-like motif domain-containing protein n=1 Tax=Albula glossodonta TaxID=121402 RepID=A0A8T2NU85_9TELE|nr:hypothetical protein JZ751_011193 [Albula glossodonta]
MERVSYPHTRHADMNLLPLQDFLPPRPVPVPTATPRIDSPMPVIPHQKEQSFKINGSLSACNTSSSAIGVSSESNSYFYSKQEINQSRKVTVTNASSASPAKALSGAAEGNHLSALSFKRNWNASARPPPPPPPHPLPPPQLGETEGLLPLSITPPLLRSLSQARKGPCSSIWNEAQDPLLNSNEKMGTHQQCVEKIIANTAAKLVPAPECGVLGPVVCTEYVPSFNPSVLKDSALSTHKPIEVKGPGGKATIIHAQYNTPISMYSQDAIMDAIAGQSQARGNEMSSPTTSLPLLLACMTSLPLFPAGYAGLDAC